MPTTHLIAPLLVLMMLSPLVAAAPAPDEKLNQIVAAAVEKARQQFTDQKFAEDQLAITVVDMSNPDNLRSGSFRGNEQTFPASVVKVFYLVAAHQWLEEGKLHDSPELQRTLKDMIVDSSNDATAMIVDALTGATNGAPLPDEQMEKWSHDRHAVNRYFTQLGYSNINVCQKTYCEGPYGRERLFFGEKFTNRNMLTTDATARLMAEIVLKRVVTPARCDEMMKLMQRDFTGEGKRDAQATDYVAKGLPDGTRLWSKAGWTSSVRHDAAYIETPQGHKLALAIFTSGQSNQKEIIPTITGHILAAMERF
jgi:beta-lactamase class A